MAIIQKAPAQVTVTTAGTRVQLSSSAVPTRSITVQALPGNTGNIYVGTVTVDSTKGHILQPGQAMKLSTDEGREELILSDYYVDSATSGDKVVFSYEGKR
jgi:hypothetical protein